MSREDLTIQIGDGLFSGILLITLIIREVNIAGDVFIKFVSYSRINSSEIGGAVTVSDEMIIFVVSNQVNHSGVGVMPIEGRIWSVNDLNFPYGGQGNAI